MISNNCKIVSVGKRRDGGTRYWCLLHRADATAKYGRKEKQCRYANFPAIPPDQVLSLDIAQYPAGGIALWGAVPPVYDTTRLPVDRGIHVHARRHGDGTKEIDHTYRKVKVIDSAASKKSEALEVTELASIYYMVSSIFGYSMKYIECTFCDYPHLDKDWFSVHAHRSHLCSGCGKYFRDNENAIGNPLEQVHTSLMSRSRSTIPANRQLKLKQSDYPGGLQIWGSNPAIVWTAVKPEEEGIHIHAFKHGSADPDIDDTFSHVEIDGKDLDVAMVRTSMAQSALPHISGRIRSIDCPNCGESHFDKGEKAFNPHIDHRCEYCDTKFRCKGRLRKTIGNPINDVLEQLTKYAVNSPQKHDLGLLPEAP